MHCVLHPTRRLSTCHRLEKHFYLRMKLRQFLRLAGGGRRGGGGAWLIVTSLRHLWACQSSWSSKFSLKCTVGSVPWLLNVRTPLKAFFLLEYFATVSSCSQESWLGCGYLIFGKNTEWACRRRSKFVLQHLTAYLHTARASHSVLARSTRISERTCTQHACRRKSLLAERSCCMLTLWNIVLLCLWTPAVVLCSADLSPSSDPPYLAKLSSPTLPKTISDHSTWTACD